MPKYMCPECEAVLKRTQAVPSGKKIKCPKCEFIFAAKPMDDDDEDEEETPAKKANAKQPAAEAKKPAKPSDDEEDEGGTYGVKEDAKENEEAKVKFEDLRKKFPKSKRGPAMALTVVPSNFMMILGFIEAIIAIIQMLVQLWPLVFSNEPPTGSAKTEKVVWFIFYLFIFGVACCICYGASKMHELESLGWSWAATVLVILSWGLLGWIAGYLAIKALNSDEVKEGFEETLERKSELKHM
jgi:hypothetical protein